MVDKEFIVTHAKAKAPITCHGETLEDALKSEGLDPNIWRPISPIEPEESPPGTESPPG